MDPNLDYANIYKESSRKLQKKIFRHVNVDEPRNDFAYVAKSLAGEEAYEYAAVFTLGKAKCESMSGKSLAEAAALMEAGRLFARAEENLQTTSAFSSGEFLENALSCFLKAAKIYDSCMSLTHAANCYIFAGDTLWKFRKLSEAVKVYSLAADIFCRDAPRVTHILMKCLQIYVISRDYSSALNTVFKIQTLVLDACATHGYEIELFLEQLKVTEVYRVLLVLFTLPPKSKAISKDGPMSLSPYIDENGEITQGSIAEYLDEDLFINLKSLILAHTSEDLNSLDITASFLQACLDSTQRGILQDLVEQATNPPDDVL
ncbi:unnamed protein product [Hymenolepis diminuta]|uniref:TPR_REGION domain-containing protein n=1 Tax=Hymenolepis diminuta TaxID=6216 RepID=A0A564YWH4_HYMDI|nr:unnamed protein product [Hymenolepis diminuta]